MAKVTTYPGRRFVAESVGDRMALIRQALGSIREPITQEALGERVGFDKYKISRIERGAQELSRSDAIAIAAVDPLHRGPAWLMFGEDEGDQPATTVEAPDDLPPIVRTEGKRPIPMRDQAETKGKAVKRPPGRSAMLA